MLTDVADSVDQFGHDHEFTKLIVNHKGVDPDDVFSSIPYEKGFHFLYFLDRTIGRTNFDKFIPHYFSKWSAKSLDSFEFKQTFIDFCKELEAEDPSIKDKVAKIDWLSSKEATKPYGSMVVYLTKSTDARRLLADGYFHVGGESGTTSIFEYRPRPMQCYHCQEIGHKASSSRNVQITP